MLVLERKNDFGIFIATPKTNKWVWCTHLKLPNDYRWISLHLCQHLGIERRVPSTEDLLEAIKIFIEFEKQLVDEEYLGWIAETPITCYKQIRFFDSVGAKEYFVDENHQVWFVKRKEDILKNYSWVNVKERLERKMEV